MKTTIELPDDLFLKAKLLAVERRTTLKEIMVQALKMFTSAPTNQERKSREATIQQLFQAMQASNTEPMVPLKRDEIHDR